jgi:hypothetical protein
MASVAESICVSWVKAYRVISSAYKMGTVEGAGRRFVFGSALLARPTISVSDEVGERNVCRFGFYSHLN